MVKLLRLALACVLIVGLGAPSVTHAQSPCQQGSLDGQRILICIPPNWNGQLVVYAHGYVVPQAPLVLPLDELIFDGQFVPDILLSLGFAFATTSYSKNGYAIEQGVNDLNALVDHFNLFAPYPADKAFITGASEGGIITTKLVERFPEKYSGGLALCGPVGGMPRQIRYLYDFRVVFDYFFPDVFPFGAVDVPPNAFLNWDAYVQAITAAILSNPDATNQLFNVTRAARDPLDPANSAVATAVGVLFYSIFGTNDLIATAGGNPYGNLFTRYRGSTNDAALNAGVERVQSNPAARAYVRNFYDTTGQLNRPLVTLHNILDPAIPFRHELIYFGKVLFSGRIHNLIVLPVPGYGHCNFTVEQVLGAFGLLLLQSAGKVDLDLEYYLPALPEPYAGQDQ